MEIKKNPYVDVLKAAYLAGDKFEFYGEVVSILSFSTRAGGPALKYAFLLSNGSEIVLRVWKV